MNNVEVDLLIKNGNTIFPIEIKSSATFSETFIDGISKFKKSAPSYNVNSGLVISNIEKPLTFNDIRYIHLINHKNDLYNLLKDYL